MKILLYINYFLFLISSILIVLNITLISINSLFTAGFIMLVLGFISNIVAIYMLRSRINANQSRQNYL